VLKGDDNSINFKHLSLELMFRCILFAENISRSKIIHKELPPKSTKKFKSFDVSSGRLLHWKKMKPSWYHASPIVPASSGRSIFV